MVASVKIIADNGEGSTVEEGTEAIDIRPEDAVLVLRPDLTHRLIIPPIELDKDVNLHVLALTAVAVLLRDNPEWAEQLTTEVFGDDEEEEDDSTPGPRTRGSA